IETVPTIKRALPIREIRKEIRSLNRALDGRIVGTTHDYAKSNHLEIVKAGCLEPSDNQRFKNYAVLAAETARTLFPHEDPIGETVKLGSDFYTIIGVTKERASTAGIGGSLAAQDFNKDVYIPLNTCKLRFGERLLDMRSGAFAAEETQLTQITLQVGEIGQVRATVPIIQGGFEPYHPKKDVEMTVPYDLLEQARSTARQFSIILGTIASISLL